MGDFLPRKPLKHRAKFDAASFVLAGEIRNLTNTQNKQTNNKWYIYTLPISACVDNKSQRVVKELWRKAASLPCHPLRRRIDSSDLDPIYYMVYRALMSQPPNGISIGSAVFAYSQTPKTPVLCQKPLPFGNLHIHLMVVLWAHPSQFPKRHLDQFSHLCRLTHVTNRHTDTDRQRYSVCSNSPHLMPLLSSITFTTSPNNFQSYFTDRPSNKFALNNH